MFLIELIEFLIKYWGECPSWPGFFIINLFDDRVLWIKESIFGQLLNDHPSGLVRLEFSDLVIEIQSRKLVKIITRCKLLFQLCPNICNQSRTFTSRIFFELHNYSWDLLLDDGSEGWRVFWPLSQLNAVVVEYLQILISNPLMVFPPEQYLHGAHFWEGTFDFKFIFFKFARNILVFWFERKLKAVRKA